MTRYHRILFGSVLVAGLLAPPVAAQGSWGEPYSASQESRPDPGDDALTVTNRSPGPIWVRTNDPEDWDIVVSTTPMGGAAPIEPGMARDIGLTPGQYQVVSDGNRIGDPIQIVGGRDYALELVHQPRPPDLTFAARLVEDGGNVVVSWAGRNLTASSAVVEEHATVVEEPAPPPATVVVSRFFCPYHANVELETPGPCPVCSTLLIERRVEVEAPPRKVVAYQCPVHVDQVSSTPAPCRICNVWMTQTMLDVR